MKDRHVFECKSPKSKQLPQVIKECVCVEVCSNFDMSASYMKRYAKSAKNQNEIT